jgi:hypothetical protein
MTTVQVSSPRPGVAYGRARPGPAGIDLENRTQTMTSMTLDLREAVTAFVEKRPPGFGGR